MTPERIPIAVRGYAIPVRAIRGVPASTPDQPSEWSLALDAETDTESAAQHLLYLFYRVYWKRELFRAGIAYDSLAITTNELRTIRDFAINNCLECIDIDEFREHIFYRYAYDLRAAVCFANAFFDLGRMTLDHGPAKGNMSGGFSLSVSRSPNRPAVRIKKLTVRAARVDFAAARQPLSKIQQRTKQKASTWRGFFVDVLTAGNAILGGRHTLESLGRDLRIDHPKFDVPEFGRPIDDRQLEYAMRDPLATAECYVALGDRYAKLGLPTPLNRIYSEASISKAYLRKMGILPWLQAQPDFDPGIIGYLMSTFVAGRTDVKIRRQIRRVRYCDFTSLYPSVCVLQRLWRFVIAKGMEYSDTTQSVQHMLDTLTLEDLQHPDIWTKLPCIVQARWDEDVLPIRGEYGNDLDRRVGFNYFSQDDGEPLLWSTLADCMASRLVTGNSLKVVRALSFEPLEPQDDLSPASIGGIGGEPFDPYDGDFFKAIVERRAALQKIAPDEGSGDGQTYDQIEATRSQLKVLVNSIYGFFEEFNIKQLADPVEQIIYSFRGREPGRRWLTTLEIPGPYFQPLLGTCISSAPHLILAIAEKLAQREGIEWMLCDTDSMAFARPDGMDDADFVARVDRIRAWFGVLNPYTNVANDEFFKIEPTNYAKDSKIECELFGLAIAPKSYCLFNIDGQGGPIIREGKQHSLGHLYPPYARSTMEERSCLKSTKLRCWQRDLWEHVVRAYIDDHADVVDYAKLENTNLPAAHRFAVSTLKTEQDCAAYNRDKLYRDRIRPGGFLISFSPKNRLWLQGCGEPVDLEISLTANSESVRLLAEILWRNALRKQEPYWDALRGEGEARKIVPDMRRDPISKRWKIERRFADLPRRILGKASSPRDLNIMSFTGNLGHITEALRKLASDPNISEADVLAFFGSHGRPPQPRDFIVDARAQLATRRDPISPFAPYDKNIREAALRCFDRNTGRSVSVEELKTYAETLARFHIRSQEKYNNGKHLDRGATSRRHVSPSRIDIIGKETRQLAAEDPMIYQGFTPTQFASVPSLAFVREAARKAGGIRALSRGIRCSPSHLTRVVNGVRPATQELLEKIAKFLMMRAQQQNRNQR